MTRTTLCLAVLALLAGCAARSLPPEDPLQCPKPNRQEPVDGGIGGTGNQPPEACKPAEG